MCRPRLALFVICFLAVCLPARAHAGNASSFTETVSDTTFPGIWWTGVQCTMVVPKNPPSDGQQVDGWCGVEPADQSMVVQAVVVWTGTKWIARAEFNSPTQDIQQRISVSPGDTIDMTVAAVELEIDSNNMIETDWYMNVVDERTGASSAPLYQAWTHANDSGNSIVVEQEEHLVSTCADTPHENIYVYPTYAGQLGQIQQLSYPLLPSDVLIANGNTDPTCKRSIFVFKDLVQF